MVHDFGMLWKERMLHTSNRTQIKNGLQGNEQPSAILLPNWIAMIKIEAHTRKTKPEYQENALGDIHAKSVSA